MFKKVLYSHETCYSYKTDYSRTAIQGETDLKKEQIQVNFGDSATVATISTHGICISPLVLEFMFSPFVVLEPIVADGRVVDVKLVAFNKAYKKMVGSEAIIGRRASKMSKATEIDRWMNLLTSLMHDDNVITTTWEHYVVAIFPTMTNGQRRIAQIYIPRQAQKEIVNSVILKALTTVTDELNASTDLEDAKRRIAELSTLVAVAAGELPVPLPPGILRAAPQER